MRRMNGRRPSPALVIALIALLAALGGTVYASSKISGKTIKKGSEPGNRLKKDTVTGTQVKESTLGEVPSATVGGPLAYAAIAADGTVQAAHSRGVTQANVTTSQVSSYCIKGVPDFKFALTTPGYVTNQNSDVTAKVTYADFPGAGSFTTDCPGAQLDVVTTVNGAFVRSPFFLALYN